MHCQMCGRKAHVLNTGEGLMECCGKPMTKAALAETAYVKHTKTVEIPVSDEEAKEAKDDLEEAEGWSGTPKGWTPASIKKFGQSLIKGGATKEDFFKKCVAKMSKHMDNPEGFCASVKDEVHGSTYWRGKGKTPQQAGKDVKAHQNVEKG